MSDRDLKLDSKVLNPQRFSDNADLYDKVRPQCPQKAVDMLSGYLGREPECVVDLGCGTGLSTLAWYDRCSRIIGVEPSGGMRKQAQEKVVACGMTDRVRFIEGYSDATGLETASADIITCSQSFHWMDPQKTLEEVNRLLIKGGIFAAYDCDFPPSCHWEAELCYEKLLSKVRELEQEHPRIKESFRRWDKDRHLESIKNSGYFRYARELVFSSQEQCTAKRFIGIALSQGGLQQALKEEVEGFRPLVDSFAQSIESLFGDKTFTIDFGYRMRIGVK